MIFSGDNRWDKVYDQNPFVILLRFFGAGDGTRTRNPQLGKLMRYHCATPAQSGSGY
jgi:hypothetical protein